MNDSELLRQYAESGSETAFTELVKVYIDFVFSAALRQVGGDAHLAQDVTQSVFVDLALKALHQHSLCCGQSGAIGPALARSREESYHHG